MDTFVTKPTAEALVRAGEGSKGKGRSGQGGRRGTTVGRTGNGSGPRPMGNLPPSARVVTQYPDGVSTGVGGGNAGPSQSVDPDGSAYIPPTGQDLSPYTPPAPTTPSPSTGRNSSPPDGSDAKGTNTGFKGYEINLDIVNADSARRGGRGMANVNDFLSEQLPVSASEKPVQPGESVVMDDDAFSLAIQRPENDKYREGFDWSKDSSVAALRSYAKGRGFDDEIVVEGASVAGTTQKTSGSPVGTADNNRAISVPGEQEVQKPKKIRGAVDSRFDDGAEYGESYATNYSKSRQARRAAFLDPNVDSSVDAVRNANNAVGIARYGNKFYANDDGTLREIDQETYDAGRHSKLTAQQLKDGYVEDVKSTLVPVNTPDSSNPNDDSEGKPGNAVDKIQHEFQGDEFQYNNDPPVGEDGVVDKWAAGMKDRYFGKYDEKGSQGNPQGGTQGRVPLNAG